MPDGRPLAVFRFDASPRIGGGHAVRCLTLADALALAGFRCALAVGPETVRTLPALASSPHNCVFISDDALEVATLAALGPIDLLVVDHYSRDAALERLCRPFSGRIAVIDDLADRPHDCDILIDTSPGRVEADYAGLVPERCTLLLGPRFALLRPQFRQARRATLERRKAGGGLSQVHVAFGLATVSEVTLAAVEGIMMADPTFQVEVMLGSDATGRERLVRVPGNVRILSDVTNVASVLARADLAVGAAGTSSWERCCLGLPTLMITTAANQKANATGLAREGAATWLGEADGVSATDIARAVGVLKADPGRRLHMATAAAGLCDGLGVPRVMPFLLPDKITRAGDRIRLRAMRDGDRQRLFDWQHEPGARRWFRDSEPPTWAEHTRWMEARLRRSDTLDLIIEDNNEAAGVVRLDPHGMVGWEVSILIAGSHRGRSIGSSSLRLLRQCIHPDPIWAEIVPGNDQSYRMFQAAGYQPTSATWLVSKPSTLN